MNKYKWIEQALNAKVNDLFIIMIIMILWCTHAHIIHTGPEYWAKDKDKDIYKIVHKKISFKNSNLVCNKMK